MTREQAAKAFDCYFFGHRWFLKAATNLDMARYVCERCERRAGLPSQHRGVPSRWLFTFWKGNDASVFDIYTGQV